MERFWQKVDRTKDCWEWTAAKKENGYGVFRVSAAVGMKYAHRLAWEMFNGPIPAGLYVCHSCDNRLCVNPHHLWLGTHTENQQDMAKKGRSHSPAKRLSNDNVREIRDYAKSATHKQTAEKFALSRSYVTRLVNGTRRGGV